MPNTDWIKQGHETFMSQIKKTVEYIGVPENAARMGFGPNDTNGKWYIETFLPVMVLYLAAFNVWFSLTKRTPQVIAALNRQEKAIKKLYRNLHERMKASDLVMDEDLVAMEFPHRQEGGGTPAPVAGVAPEVKVDTSVRRKLLVYYFHVGGNKRGKPPGQHGAECRWVLSTKRTVAGEHELTNSAFDTDSPFEFEFTEEERGMWFHCMVRWENTTGEKGPFSDIISVSLS